MIRAIHGILKATPPAFDLSLVGTMKFTGASNSNILYTKDADLMFQAGDFTIEWYQYQTDSNATPYIFDIAGEIAVSIESGNLKFWAGSSAILTQSLGTFKNQWVHLALTRSGSSLRLFKDGVQLGSTVTSSYNFNNSDNVRLGNQTTLAAGSSYGGWMTNFRWIKGTAVYTANFTRPATPLSSTGSNTKILLLATSNATVTTDTTGRGNTPSNITWQAFAQTMV